jgi:hypothetical protein
VKKFGHLHIVFRDFSFAGSREEVYQQLMGFENVGPTRATPKVQNLFSGSASSGPKERNEIRQLLLDNFASIQASSRLLFCVFLRDWTKLTCLV